MVLKVRLPKIDANVEEAAVGQWLKQEGEWVEEGEPLVELVTDKASFELEAAASGFLRKRTVGERSVVPVRYVIALLSDSPDEPLPEVEGENRQIMDAHRRAMLAGGPAQPLSEGEPLGEAGSAAPADGVRATPAARRLARAEGINLAELVARAGGVIRESDVREFMRRKGASGPADEVQ